MKIGRTSNKFLKSFYFPPQQTPLSVAVYVQRPWVSLVCNAQIGLPRCMKCGPLILRADWLTLTHVTLFNQWAGGFGHDVMKILNFSANNVNLTVASKISTINNDVVK